MNQLYSDKATLNTAPTFTGLELSSGTPHIDFHFGGSTADYTSRIIEYASGAISVTGSLNAGALLQNGTSIIDLINVRIKITTQAIAFSSGSATITIDGASAYYAAMAQVLSNNEYVVTQTSHYYGDDKVTLFVRNCTSGAALTGT
ncbi:MAG: hypothetical protein ACRDBO_21025 [Lachnospiraceae bacterium]